MDKKTLYSLYPDRRRPDRHLFRESDSATLHGLDEPEAIRLMGIGNKAEPDAPHRLYVHIPFCLSICTFCIFRPVIKDPRKVGTYLRALHHEIQQYAKSRYGQTVSIGSVYFGGGTPTCLTAGQLVDLLKILRRSFAFTGDAEVTVEASPSSADKEKLTACRAGGANRISFGIQTFSDRLGRILGLPQRTDQAVGAFRAARRAGYMNIDMDLLYNIPTQTMDEWRETLEHAAALRPENLSLYPLNPGAHTVLARLIEMGQVPPPGPVELEIDMYLLAKKILEKAGYAQYATTNFSILPEGKRHGEITFRHGQNGLLAFGACAGGRINRYRYRNIRNIDGYVRTIDEGRFPIGFGDGVSEKDLMTRYIDARIRLMRVDCRDFQMRFGAHPQSIFPKPLSRLTERGLIETDKDSIRLTLAGCIWSKRVEGEFAEQAAQGGQSNIGPGDPR